MRRGTRSLAAMAALVLVACGGGSPTAAPTKAAWTARHGPAVAALNTDLETARTALSSLQRPDILGNCSQLRDSLAEARKALPVPDPTADAALRAAMDAVAVGMEDCIQGARGPDIPQLEKSFAELREAHALLDAANRTIAAWTEGRVSDAAGPEVSADRARGPVSERTRSGVGRQRRSAPPVRRGTIS